MKKNVLITAIGAALAAGAMTAAQAEVKVYGQLQFEVADESVDNPLAGVGDGFLVRTSNWNDGITVEDNARGRFGIKADEDLGGGLTGFGVLEYDIGTPSEFGSGPEIREANVGLKGGFGAALLGVMKQPYKYTGGVDYDPFVTTNLEARRNGGMSGGTFGHNGFASNALGYISPNWGGFSLWAVYSPDENPNNTNFGGDGDYSASFKFGMGNWEVFAALSHDDDNDIDPTNASLETDLMKVGGKVSFGNHTIVAQVEDTEQETSLTGGREGQVIFVGYNLLMGPVQLVVQGATGELEATGTAAGVPDQEWEYAAVGAWYNFSKTTRAFAGYSLTQVDNEGFAAAADGDRDVISVGLRKVF